MRSMRSKLKLYSIFEFVCDRVLHFCIGTFHEIQFVYAYSGSIHLANIHTYPTFEFLQNKRKSYTNILLTTFSRIDPDCCSNANVINILFEMN